MIDQLYEYNILVKSLPECEEELLKILRFETISPDQDIRVMVRNLLNEATIHMKIKAGYRIFEKSEIRIEKDSLTCGNVLFESDTTVAQLLEGSSTLIIFAVTLGPDFDAWSRNYFNMGDPFAGYVADVIGSIRVEQATDWINDRIEKHIASNGLSCTNRYSPGYCGWDVYEQHKLFSLLPDQFIGIQLNPSALMTPMKSVSGIIGAGKQLSKQPYTCSLCSQENCFMRRGKTGAIISM